MRHPRHGSLGKLHRQRQAIVTTEDTYLRPHPVPQLCHHPDPRRHPRCFNARLDHAMTVPHELCCLIQLESRCPDRHRRVRRVSRTFFLNSDGTCGAHLYALLAHPMRRICAFVELCSFVYQTYSDVT